MDNLSTEEQVRVVLPVLLCLLYLIFINIWYYRKGMYDAHDKVVYVPLVRIFEFCCSIAVLAILDQSNMKSPCFFGMDLHNRGDERACESGFGLASITLLYTVATLFYLFVNNKPEFHPWAKTIDFIFTWSLTVLWLTVAVYLSVQLHRKVDRCGDDPANYSNSTTAAASSTGTDCAGASSFAYQSGVSTVELAFLLFFAFALSLPDVFIRSGYQLTKYKENLNAQHHSFIWRLAEVIGLNLMVGAVCCVCSFLSFFLFLVLFFFFFFLLLFFFF